MSWEGKKYFNNSLFEYIFEQKIRLKINMTTDKGNIQNEMWHWTNDETEVVYKVGSECELNSWPDSPVG